MGLHGSDPPCVTSLVGKLCRNALILCVLALAVRAEDEAARLYHEGERAERRGDVLEAYLLYARAAALDPGNLAIADHKNKASVLVASNATVRDANTEPNPDLSFLQLVESEGAGQVDEFGPAAPPPHLNPAPIKKAFDLRADPAAVFQQVGQAFGIRMLFETNYTGQPFTFRTGELDMFEAFRLLEQMTNSLVEPIDAHTAFVVRDTAQRRTEVIPMVTATIPIPERIAVQEAQEIITSVQQALEIRRAQVDPGRRLVLLRDSAAKVALARVLFADLSRLRAQVEIEIELRTVTKDSSTSIGFTLPNSATLLNLGTFLNNTISPSGVSNFLTFGGGKTLFGLGVATAQAFATMTDSSADNLLKAQILALDGQPASLTVGTRYPIATAQYLGTTGPALTTPTPTITYQDLGLVLKITPTVHDGRQMTLDVDAAFTTLGATAGNGLPEIQQRKFTGKVRMVQGEWAVIAGLTQTNDARTTTGIAGLASIPLIGHLFRNDTVQKDSDETLIIIKPRLVNLPPWDFPVKTLATGTEGRFISLY